MMKQRVEQAILTAGIWSGPTLPGFAAALGTALDSWAPSWTIQGVAVGVGVGGSVSGLLTLTPLLTCYSQVPVGLSGVLTPQMTQLVCLGVAAGVTGVSYQGSSPSVGMGADTSKVAFADSGTLQKALTSAFIAAWGQEGVTASLIASYLAPAITAHVLTATGTGTVVGPGSQFPTTGPTNSHV